MVIFLGGNMNPKAYDFRYSDFSVKFISGLTSFCSNLMIPIVLFYIIAAGMSIAGVLKHLTVELVMLLLVFSGVVGLFFAIKYCCCFKGIILYKDYLEITTQTLGFGKSKPKIKINYSDIENIFNNTNNIRYDRKKARKAFIAGDYNYYVELTLKGGKQFCFSVDNQEKFIDDVIERMHIKNNSASDSKSSNDE